MPPITSTIEIACPPKEVFAYATDPGRFAEWQSDVADVRIHGDRPPGLGTRFTTTRKIGRVEYRTTQEITDFGPPISFAARSVDGPLRVNATIAVEPIDGGSGSRVTFTLEFHGRGAGKMLMPDVIGRIAARRSPESHRNLKERLERGTYSGPDQRRRGAAGGAEHPS
jgi:uncharacterized protein YndB with AHSA1/START domain